MKSTRNTVRSLRVPARCAPAVFLLLPVAAEARPEQDSIPNPQAEPPAAIVSPAADIADTERDFDRLDRSAGLRSGGAFPFDFQHLAFYSDPEASAAGAVTLWTAANVQADRVQGVPQDGWRYSLDMQVDLFQGDTLAYTTAARSTLVFGRRLTESDMKESGFPIYTQMAVPPGEYEYVIRIRDNGRESGGINEKRGTLVVPAPVTTHPFISSIAVASDSAGTWIPASNFELQLNAAKVVHRDGRPFVYFEAYGLTPGGAYRGEVRLVSRWVSTGQGEAPVAVRQPFQLAYRGNVPEDPDRPVRKILRLDLSETQAGPYEIQIRVRDLETGVASEVRTARLKVTLPETYRRPALPVLADDTP